MWFYQCKIVYHALFLCLLPDGRSDGNAKGEFFIQSDPANIMGYIGMLPQKKNLLIFFCVCVQKIDLKIEKSMWCVQFNM